MDKNYLKNLRQRLKLNQTQMGEKLEISQGYYGELERGAKPLTAELIQKLQELDVQNNAEKVSKLESGIDVDELLDFPHFSKEFILAKAMELALKKDAQMDKILDNMNKKDELIEKFLFILDKNNSILEKNSDNVAEFLAFMQQNFPTK